MKDDRTGVPVKKITFLNKKLQVDLKQGFTALMKAGIVAFTANPISIIKEAVGVITAVSEKPNASDLAYKLILTSLINAAHKLATENQPHFKLETSDHEEIYTVPQYLAFLNGFNHLLDSDDIIFDYNTIKYPRTIPLIKPFQSYFISFLEIFGIESQKAQLISNRLPSYFVFEFNDEWRKNYTKYELLKQQVDGPISEAARREQEWETYYRYLEYEVAKPVFDEGFSLADIFIDLRAAIQPERKKRHSRHQVELPKKKVVALKKNIQQWLNASGKENSIQIIQGGPGSGKSSFAKMLATQVANEGNYRVLFFPLHHFNIYDNIREAVKEFFTDVQDFFTSFHPLETKSDLPFLLIFDGLDELVKQGKAANEAADAFISQLIIFCANRNSTTPHQTKVKALITGRPIAIQNTEARLRERDEQILYLLPYYLEDKEQENYQDPEKLLQVDLRCEWWDKFYKLKKIKRQADLPSELKNPIIDNITKEPLLNYLVALTWQKTPTLFNDTTNLNDIYYNLITNVYERSWDGNKHTSSGNLNDDQFIQILEEIAICAWQGGDARVTTVNKIETHIKKRNLSHLLDEYKKINKGGVSRLLTAFYFRKYHKSEENNEAFEFTHKSFGEYLAARSIVELIQMIHDEYTDYKNKQNSRRPSTWNIETCLKEWLRVTGANVLDYNLNSFIRNELNIRAKEGADITAWQRTLVELLNHSMNYGMPLDSVIHTEHLEILRLTRNADETLVVAIADCARITKQLWKVEFQEIDPELYALKLFNRLATSFLHFDFCFKNLCYLDLSGAHLSGAHLSRAHLSRAHLSGADLSGADLSGADLWGADLSGADLWGADLREADLREADLWGAHLSGADLREADLRGANLWKANLSGAHLSGANLREAHLREAHLRGADLRGAHLRGADLRGAHLSGAHLSGAHLMGAKGLSFELLINTKSLYNTKGIPTNLEAELKEKKPKLFTKPT